MKTIIVPTDFSPAADNAMHYAARMAQQLQANLLLLHVYTIPVSMNDVPVLMISAEELKKGADEGLARSKNELATAYPDVPMKAESRLGDVTDELSEACKATDPIAVVMGSQGSSGFEQFLFGSTALSAIKHLRYPVIAVPANYAFKEIKNMVLAADLGPMEERAKEQLQKVVQLLNSHLHVVHVRSLDEAETEPPALVQQLASLSPTYHVIEDDNVSHGIQTYLQTTEADLLIVLPHEHNLMEKLFFKMHTKDLLKSAQVPVLSIRN